MRIRTLLHHKSRGSPCRIRSGLQKLSRQEPGKRLRWCKTRPLNHLPQIISHECQCNVNRSQTHHPSPDARTSLAGLIEPYRNTFQSLRATARRKTVRDGRGRRGSLRTGRCRNACCARALLPSPASDESLTVFSSDGDQLGLIRDQCRFQFLTFTHSSDHSTSNYRWRYYTKSEQITPRIESLGGARSLPQRRKVKKVATAPAK